MPPPHWSSSFSQFSLGSQEDLGEPLHHTIVHAENEEQPLSRKTTALTLTKGAAHNGGITVTGQNDDMDGGEAACNRCDFWVLSNVLVNICKMYKICNTPQHKDGKYSYNLFHMFRIISVSVATGHCEKSRYATAYSLTSTDLLSVF